MEYGWDGINTISAGVHSVNPGTPLGAILNSILTKNKPMYYPTMYHYSSNVGEKTYRDMHYYYQIVFERQLHH